MNIIWNQKMFYSNLSSWTLPVYSWQCSVAVTVETFISFAVPWFVGSLPKGWRLVHAVTIFCDSFFHWKGAQCMLEFMGSTTNLTNIGPKRHKPGFSNHQPKPQPLQPPTFTLFKFLTRNVFYRWHFFYSYKESQYKGKYCSFFISTNKKGLN